RPKHKDRKWCLGCIDRYRRQEQMSSVVADNIILKLVEPLYADARIEDIEPILRDKILARQADQDLYLFGLPGVGKTHIMAALIRLYINQGYECKRICFDDFCCQLRSTMSPASKLTEWDMTKPFREVDMLFIDDLGLRTKQETDFAYVTLYSIINKRQERLLPTFISSNKGLDRLGQSFDFRIVSRLTTALTIEIVGKDWRQKIAKKAGWK
ncbi:hypothetical protein LCGC14_2094450, partial [marine sediment metagenome]